MVLISPTNAKKSIFIVVYDILLLSEGETPTATAQNRQRLKNTERTEGVLYYNHKGRDNAPRNQKIWRFIMFVSMIMGVLVGGAIVFGLGFGVLQLVFAGV